MMHTEHGGLVAMELAALASVEGRTPRASLQDPDRAFNLSVLRAARKARGVVFDRTMKQAAGGDEFGIRRILLALRLIYLEG